MTHGRDDSAICTALEQIIAYGLDGLETAVCILINEAMRIERSRAFGAEPWQRTDNRRGYANGYKAKSVNSRIGKLELKIPQVRGGVEFYPSALERGLRSERALKLAMAEMYIQGVSTRKVNAILKELCGLEVTSSQVSRATALLDEELEKWRHRPLGRTPFVQLDARYENLRHGGSVVSCAVLIATGVTAEGRRTVLGVSVSLSEAEVHWRQFLNSLKERGLHGVIMITSDDHPGLKSALRSVFSGVSWNRCHVHLQRNATAYVPKAHMRSAVARDIANILSAPGLEEAKRLLKLSVAKYEHTAPRLAAWMAENIPEGFTVFMLPDSLRRRLRSTNMLERLNREIARRTRVASLFPNEASLLRLVSAVLMETSEEWETNKKYLNLETALLPN
ncbi:MAG: IS256 family transposase [Bacteroidetes bacterium]|nr:MAG: IS256 family transposase [Bacteroidota bacterium]